MDIPKKINELTILLENLFSANDPKIRKEAEKQTNIFANTKTEEFFSLLTDIIISKNVKGFSFSFFYFFSFMI